MKRIIRRKEAIQLFGVSKSTFHEWQNPHSKYYKPDFPKKINLGINSVGYLQSEIEDYIIKLSEYRNSTNIIN